MTVKHCYGYLFLREINCSINKLQIKPWRSNWRYDQMKKKTTLSEQFQN